MKTKLLATAFAALMVMGAATSAVAKGSPNIQPPPPVITLPSVVTPCGPSDLGLGSATYGDCNGFYAGQYLSGNSTDLEVQRLALLDLGLVFDKTTFATLPNVSGLGGSTVLTFANLTSVVPFPTKLYGTTYVGVHFGGGADAPTPGAGSTAFYRFDAGTAGISSLTLNYGSSSDFILYKTDVGQAVPEPASWALMIMGFGGIGAMIRRRRTVFA